MRRYCWDEYNGATQRRITYPGFGALAKCKTAVSLIVCRPVWVYFPKILSVGGRGSEMKSFWRRYHQLTGCLDCANLIQTLVIKLAECEAGSACREAEEAMRSRGPSSIGKQRVVSQPYDFRANKQNNSTAIGKNQSCLWREGWMTSNWLPYFISIRCRKFIVSYWTPAIGPLRWATAHLRANMVC